MTESLPTSVSHPEEAETKDKNLRCGCGGTLVWQKLHLAVHVPHRSLEVATFEVDVMGWKCDNQSCELEAVPPETEDDIYKAIEQFMTDVVNTKKLPEKT